MIIVELLRGPDLPTRVLDGTTLAAPSVWTFLLLAVLVPVVGEAIREIGPVLLASRPEFDDLMDGLTFGVISGVSFACFDTLIRYWDLLTGGLVEPDPGLWVSLIFLHGFVKPLLIGTATGIASLSTPGSAAVTTGSPLATSGPWRWLWVPTSPSRPGSTCSPSWATTRWP